MKPNKRKYAKFITYSLDCGGDGLILNLTLAGVGGTAYDCLY